MEGGAAGQTKLLSEAKERRAERAASPRTARPDQREGQPQKKIEAALIVSGDSTFLILNRFKKTTQKIGIKSILLWAFMAFFRL